jgi:pimeloyl-ACP methyl ester carboxylesterase
MTRFKFDKSIKKVLYEYLLGTFKIANSSDCLLHYVIGPPKLKAYIPLEKYADKIKVPFHVYYGEKDRVDSSGAVRLLESSRKDFIFKYIPKASHQIALEEPDYLCDEVMGYFV